MLTAIMVDILEDTVMAAMVTILERDLPKLMPILSSSDTTHTERDLLKPKASHTTDTEVRMVDMVMVDCLGEEDGLLLGGNAELVVEGVVPDLLHVVPVGDDSVLNGVLQGEDTPLGLGLVTDVGVLLSHTDHDSL